jgi:poly(3-hydroxybutyrate) depolymerase
VKLRLQLTLSLGVLLVISANVTSAQNQQGRVQKRVYKFKEAENKEMEYAMFVPTGYDKNKPTPLIVALHGLNSTPQGIMRYPGFTKHAEKHGYIVVAPMGYNRRGWYGSFGKGGGRRGRDPKNLGELSEKDVMNVLAIARKEFNIDPKRIYLFGHSMGGGGTWHLGLKYPSIWAALAPIAPAIYRSPNSLTKITHMPVIIVQGDKDRLVSVKIARRWVAKMKELKMDHKYIEVEGGNHVLPAFQHFPEIFAFFNTHQKRPEKPVAAKKPRSTSGDRK